MRYPTRFRLLLPLLLMGGTALSGAERANGPDFPSASILQPMIVAFAHSHDIPISGIDGSAAGAIEKPGDAQTFLVTLRKGQKLKQWLVVLRIAERTPAEQAEIHHNVFSADFSTTAAGATKKYHLEYKADPTTALKVRTAGPFTPGSENAPPERTARALISPDFLKLGLDRSCATMLRLAAAQHAAPGSAAAVPSEEDIRSYVGLFPSLMSFVQGIEATPGIEGILWSVMDKPSPWSVIRHAGKVDMDVDLDDPAALDSRAWGLPAPPSYRLSLMLKIYAQPALRCVLFVTAPRPPLVASAGIVGIVAVPPSRPADRLDIRLIAAHQGGKAL